MRLHATFVKPAMLLALIAATAGCNLGNLHGRPAIERKARPVTESRATATEAIEPDTVVSPGVVEPWNAQIELSAQESGWIAELVAKEGAAVAKGELLARLEDGAQRHSVDLATADLAEAEAALAKLERGATAEELQQAEAERDAAAARDELAHDTAARTRQLHADGVVSDYELDRVASDVRAQSALLERATARLVELRRGARIEDRLAARARVEAARARLRVSQDSLARRRVLAPEAGTVLLSRLHAGEFYNVGTGPLFVLGDMTRLQVRLEVDEIDSFVPAPDARCVIYSDAGVRLAEGTVTTLAPKMGRRALPLESPTARADIRVREVFVQVPVSSRLLPNQRVWGHLSRKGAAS